MMKFTAIVLGFMFNSVNSIKRNLRPFTAKADYAIRSTMVLRGTWASVPHGGGFDFPVEERSPVVLALLGTLFTWGVTALGSSLVFVLDVVPLSRKAERRLLDASLGFSAGVMLAASYWSLLAPAIEQAEQEDYGKWSFVPATVGFLLGGITLHGCDAILRRITTADKRLMVQESHKKDDSNIIAPYASSSSSEFSKEGLRNRRRTNNHTDAVAPTLMASGADHDDEEESAAVALARARSWRRILLLVVAITLHNAPEGAAVGVGFGALRFFDDEQQRQRAYAQARNLAIGIGLQNFPEGLAVSLPLRRAGFSSLKAFFYGQLSGAVEPVAGVLGAYAVGQMRPILPYALAFAAGAMVFVVVDDILPETFASSASSHDKEGNADSTGGGIKLVTWGTMVGFALMMAMDVSLG